METKIIVDSTFDMTEETKSRLTIIPLTVTFGDTEYIDGVTITREEFYEKLIEGDTLPTTSQAPPFAFSEEIEEIVKNGDSAVIITIASTLSGTYQSACTAAADYSDRIFVVDSETTAIGGGILAERALQLIDEGRSAKEIADILNSEKKKICIIALLDTLEYLKRGGRISKTAALAGDIFSIKPVISLKDGEIKVLGKARGSKRGNNLLNEEISSCGGVDFSKPVLLGYTGLSDKMLNKYIADSEAVWKGKIEELHSTLLGSVIGTHVGPGAIAAAFFEN
ncbi:MAG: DegV family protein [Clostridia bacterium]|nr:DegV family protein [Clostridia bacterium]